MKKPFNLLTTLALFALLGCDTRTYDDISEKVSLPATVAYTNDIKPLIATNCTVCHSPGGASGFFPLTDYTLVKNAIDNILDRVQRPNGDPQKMPQGGSLSPSNIDLLKKWKNDGLKE
ncbi:MAG: cytochrome c [Flavobacteriia bacterium]|nr:cytochrome c [Flavobacteriia bacterium]MBH2024049.1 cytochrome c [Flavobacteriales bacterium]